MLATALVAAACGSSTGGATGTSGGSTTSTPVTVGFISSQTGPASSSYVDAQWGGQAAVDAQNAAGGVNGHKIVLAIEDDQSSPTGNQTDAQNLVQNKGAVGIVDDSSFTFGAAQYLSKQGVPVTGAAIDGPEWGQLMNMFPITAPFPTPIDGKYYTYNDTVNILKMMGVHRLAGVAYNIQSAIQSMSSTMQAASAVGIKDCYENRTIPFGDQDFGSVALSMKSAQCDGVYVPMLLASDIALSSAVKDAGLSAKLLFPGTAYDQNLLDQPSALNTMVGQYTTAEVDLTHPNAGSKTMLANLKKYTGYKKGIPNLNIVIGYVSTELMIKGLEGAGSSPTLAKVVSSLRKVSNFTAGGIMPNAMSFQNWGTVGMFPKSQCEPVFRITQSGYSELNNGKPVCGSRAATSSA